MQTIFLGFSHHVTGLPVKIVVLVEQVATSLFEQLDPLALEKDFLPQESSFVDA